MNRVPAPGSRLVRAGAANVHYEVAERTRGFTANGIGAIHRTAQSTGLVGEVAQQPKLLKVHLPYHESDHVLNLAHNELAGGRLLRMESTAPGHLPRLGAGPCTPPMLSPTMQAPLPSSARPTRRPRP